jgi:hypothetical protein
MYDYILWKVYWLLLENYNQFSNFHLGQWEKGTKMLVQLGKILHKEHGFNFFFNICALHKALKSMI